MCVRDGGGGGGGGQASNGKIAHGEFSEDFIINIDQNMGGRTHIMLDSYLR